MPSRIFISSQINEIRQARKAVIDTVHNNDHIPVFLEEVLETKEVKVKDKLMIDALLESSDALVLIYYISLGFKESVFDNLTPIQYEFQQFKKIKPNAPCLLIGQIADPSKNAEQGLIEWVTMISDNENVSHDEYGNPNDLSVKVNEWIQSLELNSMSTGSSDKMIVRYNGPDYLGLLSKITEILFCNFALNIEYISFAAKYGKATFYITCSQGSKLVNKERLADTLQTEIERESKGNEIKTSTTIVRGSDLLNVQIDNEAEVIKQYQYYLEIRTLNVPGQLSAISKILRDLDFNIDELSLKPTEKEYKGQTTITIWVSHLYDVNINVTSSEMTRLDTLINGLAGVRSLYIKLCRYV